MSEVFSKYDLVRYCYQQEVFFLSLRCLMVMTDNRPKPKYVPVRWTPRIYPDRIDCSGPHTHIFSRQNDANVCTIFTGISTPQI
jgi:hypothetical protein